MIAGSVVMFDKANEAPAADDCVRFDVAAQQLSASSCVIRRFEVVPCDVDLCIGQLVPFTQHAIRASGVACQPAQTATFPTHSVRMAAILARRLLQATLFVECGMHGGLSNARKNATACRMQSNCRGCTIAAVA